MELGRPAVLAAPDGTVQWWSAKHPEEPLDTYPDFAAAIRKLLTDLWELDTDDDDRTAVAELLLPTEQVEAGLVPVER
ncbi:hypothetical protein FCG67_18500 [Rhodococcus oryzae]|uniref:Uncharacterized protein n=1 Tax=Rhodococcus oryzae TaxID=2571143 RepID=A0ABY2RGF8_9NOCA|nr:hypothetical protein [Rhodococcus oryzae]TJZ76010.1 hypothetical protein FCG67_18500 [Rhodococcus oryzae]